MFNDSNSDLDNEDQGSITEFDIRSDPIIQVQMGSLQDLYKHGKLAKANLSGNTQSFFKNFSDMGRSISKKNILSEHKSSDFDVRLDDVSDEVLEELDVTREEIDTFRHSDYINSVAVYSPKDVCITRYDDVLGDKYYHKLIPTKCGQECVHKRRACIVTGSWDKSIIVNDYYYYYHYCRYYNYCRCYHCNNHYYY